MNRKKLHQQYKDRPFIVGLLTVGGLIAVGGLVYLHLFTVLDFLLYYIGFAGTLVCVGLAVYASLWLLEYLTENEDELG